MARKQRPEKFVKDLVIAGEDGKLYYLKESEWKARPLSVSAFAGDVQQALKTGVALAAIPEHEDDPKTHELDAHGKPVHPLGFCYLISLASLKTHTIYED
jgi:hypothetical protein